MDDVRRDLAGTSPMLRLLQGDVGSGKTAVAAYALAAAARAGFQGALLAPTDLLARAAKRYVPRLIALTLWFVLGALIVAVVFAVRILTQH